MKYFVRIDGKKQEIEIPDSEGKGDILIDKVSTQVEYRILEDLSGVDLHIDNRPFHVDFQEENGHLQLQVEGKDFNIEVLNEREESISRIIGHKASKKSNLGEIRAPMPGLIIKINVENGSKVEKGSSLLIVEAMKMENEIPSPIAGTVINIYVSKGDAVKKGQMLISLKT